MLTKVNIIFLSRGAPVCAPKNRGPGWTSDEGLGRTRGSAPTMDVDQFTQYLNSKGLKAIIRTSRGGDIEAACGQLKIS